MVSFAIGFGGPIVIKILFSAMVSLLAKANKKESKLSLMSHLGGSCVSIFWGGGMLFLLMMAVLVTPFNLFGLGTVKADVVGYKTFTFLSDTFGEKYPVLTYIKEPVDISQSSLDMQVLQNTTEYKELMEDDRRRD